MGSLRSAEPGGGSAGQRQTSDLEGGAGTPPQLSPARPVTWRGGAHVYISTYAKYMKVYASLGRCPGARGGEATLSPHSSHVEWCCAVLRRTLHKKRAACRLILDRLPKATR